jgi:hypothetical protein
MSAAAIIMLRRKKLIRRFAEQGATSPDQAIPFANVGVRRSWVFDQMVDRGVFAPVGSDRYYMDESKAQAFLVAQRRSGLIVTGGLLLLFLLYLLASIRW